MTYRPMPEEFTIAQSKLDGVGVFAIRDLNAGITFISYPTHYIPLTHRLNFGGFINHSSDPNCKLVDIGDYSFLKTIKYITEGEEITVDYSEATCGKGYSCETLSKFK